MFYFDVMNVRTTYLGNSLVHLFKEEKQKRRILLQWLQTERANANSLKLTLTPICYVLLMLLPCSSDSPDGRNN